VISLDRDISACTGNPCLRTEELVSCSSLYAIFLMKTLRNLSFLGHWKQPKRKLRIKHMPPVRSRQAKLTCRQSNPLRASRRKLVQFSRRRRMADRPWSSSMSAVNSWMSAIVTKESRVRPEGEIGKIAILGSLVVLRMGPHDNICSVHLPNYFPFCANSAVLCIPELMIPQTR
jgi:hypothetical protein